MKTLKTIGITLLVIIVLMVIISFLLPSKIRVERSLLMNAPVETVFDQVNNLKNWDNWSPWHQLDAKMIKQYEGPESGQGASYFWKSEDDRLGTGSLTITQSKPNELIVTEMNFMEQGKGSSSYIFEKADQGTRVTWTMDADMGMNPIGRYYGLFMDRMVGSDFEKGLINLKTITEK